MWDVPPLDLADPVGSQLPHRGLDEQVGRLVTESVVPARAALEARWPQVAFATDLREARVRVAWTDGPSVAQVCTLLAPLLTVCVEIRGVSDDEAGASPAVLSAAGPWQLMSCQRKFSPVAVCAAAIARGIDPVEAKAMLAEREAPLVTRQLLRWCARRECTPGYLGEELWAQAQLLAELAELHANDPKLPELLLRCIADRGVDATRAAVGAPGEQVPARTGTAAAHLVGMRGQVRMGVGRFGDRPNDRISDIADTNG